MRSPFAEYGRIFIACESDILQQRPRSSRRVRVAAPVQPHLVAVAAVVVAAVPADARPAARPSVSPTRTRSTPRHHCSGRERRDVDEQYLHHAQRDVLHRWRTGRTFSDSPPDLRSALSRPPAPSLQLHDPRHQHEWNGHGSVVGKGREVESRAKIFGHPLHQILVVFPLGLFGSGATCDLIGMVRGGGQWRIVALYMIGGGVWADLPRRYSVSWTTSAFRRNASKASGADTWDEQCGCRRAVWVQLVPPHGRISDAVPTRSRVLVWWRALACLAGWFGGELVNRMGVGIDDGAHLDATGASLAAASPLAPARQESRAAG